MTEQNTQTSQYALEDVRDALRALDASLKALSRHRRDAGDIISSDLSRLLGQEIAGILGGGRHDTQEPARRVGSRDDLRGDAGPLGQKNLELLIDQMVASALLRGRQTTGILGGIFNILPGLSGR
jgi:hypothetical protein